MIYYCKNCKQVVKPKRYIGFGTVLMIIVTGFMWLLFIPFYRKRCPICYDGGFIVFKNSGVYEEWVRVEKRELNRTPEWIRNIIIKRDK